MVSGVGIVLYFAWLAAGLGEHSFAERLGWVLALTLFGMLAAPVFWFRHVRPTDVQASTS